MKRFGRIIAGLLFQPLIPFAVLALAVLLFIMYISASPFIPDRDILEKEELPPIEKCQMQKVHDKTENLYIVKCQG